MTKQERIDYIADLMRSMEFKTGRTVKRLAKKWGMSIETLKKDSAEASRIVRAELQDPDRVGASVGAALERALARADRRGEEGSEKADDTVGRLANVWATISGAKAAERLEHKVEGEVSPQEALKIMERRFGKVTPKEEGEE